MPDNGRYARKPIAEIRSILEAYERDEEIPDEPKDPWDVDTAVESPNALSSPAPHKRSGEYLIHLEDEFQQRLADERRLAVVKFGRRR